MDKRFWAILVAIVVVLGGIFWFTSSSKTSAPGSKTSNQPTSHVEGNGSTGVALLEYGDYECPFCGQYYPIVKQVQSEYNNLITFQFRNLPLTQLHPNAFAGARAAEAASLQGKFWQMHDTLYENQDPNGQSGWVADHSDVLDDYFVKFAQQDGLNVTQFKTDFASTQVNNAINADLAAFTKTGAQEATPTFFLDGVQIQPAESVASFEQLINKEIQKKTGKPSPVGTSSTTSTSTSGAAPQSHQ